MDDGGDDEPYLFVPRYAASAISDQIPLQTNDILPKCNPIVSSSPSCANFLREWREILCD